MSTPEIAPTAAGEGPDPSPLTRLASRTSTWLIAAAAFQFVILAWMIGGTTLLFRPAVTGYVQVVPIDPRDLFTGEYVILSYAFSRVPPGGVAGLPGPYNYDGSQEWKGCPVYVELIPDPARPDHFAGGPPSLTPPADAPYLQGTLETPTLITFGIERFHVQEGEGSAFEDAARDRDLWARIDVTAEGKAMVKGLVIEGPDEGRRGAGVENRSRPHRREVSEARSTRDVADEGAVDVDRAGGDVRARGEA